MKQSLIIIASDKAKVIRKIEKSEAEHGKEQKKPRQRLDVITINGKRRVIVRQD